MYFILLCEKLNKYLLVPSNSTSSPTNYLFDEKKPANINL